MSAGLLAQYAVIGLVLLASVAVVVRKLAPKPSARWLAAAALRLDRPGAARCQRWLARALQPKQTSGNCSDGCDTCGACGPKPPAAAHPPAAAQPLHFRPRDR